MSDKTKIDRKSLGENIGQTNSPALVQLERDADAAEQALADVNCAELFRLWEKAVRERGDSMKTMLNIANHYIGENPNPFYQSTGAIEAMERVSLAAIELAKQIAVVKK